MQWERAAWGFGTLAVTIHAGCSLSLKVVVAGPNADDDMRLGFDAVGFESSFVPWPGKPSAQRSQKLPDRHRLAGDVLGALLGASESV